MVSRIFLFLLSFPTRARGHRMGHFPVALGIERGVSFEIEGASCTKSHHRKLQDSRGQMGMRKTVFSELGRRSQQPPNKVMQLTSTLASQGVLRPPWSLGMLAADYHVRLAKSIQHDR